MGIVAPSFLITAAIRKLPYDPFKNFEHLCRLIELAAGRSRSTPYRLIKPMATSIAAAHARPGALMLGANGPATTQHLVAEMLKKAGSERT
jgi:tripartite-type tricarboxylate transporter receptor subunit TctC